MLDPLGQLCLRPRVLTAGTGRCVWAWFEVWPFGEPSIYRPLHAYMYFLLTKKVPHGKLGTRGASGLLTNL